MECKGLKTKIKYVQEEVRKQKTPIYVLHEARVKERNIHKLMEIRWANMQ